MLHESRREGLEITKTLFREHEDCAYRMYVAGFPPLQR